jgi:hypothetical protein
LMIEFAWFIIEYENNDNIYLRKLRKIILFIEFIQWDYFWI